MSLLGALDPLHNPDSGIVPVEPDERQQVRRLMTVFLDAVGVGVPKQKLEESLSEKATTALSHNEIFV